MIVPQLNVSRVKRLFFLLGIIMLSLFANRSVAIPPSSSLSKIVVNRMAISAKISYGSKPLGNFLSITIPLKRAGRLFLIEAQVDDQIGNLVFDTGAEMLVLNKTYFRNYNATPKYSGAGITGSLDEVVQIKTDMVQVSSVYYERLNADLADLSHIENMRGVKILGLFGLSMIKDFEVVFDAVKSELRLHRVDKKGDRLNLVPDSILYDIVQHLESPSSILRVEAKISGKTLYFCIDTGAETNVINSSVSKAVLSTINISRRSRLRGAGASSTEVLYGAMTEFAFGEHPL